MKEADGFEEIIGKAMRARPEYVPETDIAVLAVERVRAQQEKLAKLARLSKWWRLSSAAAGILLTISVAIGYWLWPASTSSSTSDTTTATTTSTIDLTSVGVAAFVIALVAVMLLVVMTPERQTPRLQLA